MSGEKLTIKYWNGRGLAEIPRVMLALKGKFPGEDYNDVRATTDDLATYGAGVEKVTAMSAVEGTLDANLGRMPCVQVGDGASIGQSGAINFYVASELGMNGANSLETAQIMSISEHLVELKKAIATVHSPYNKDIAELNDDMLATLFDTPAGPNAGKAGEFGKRFIRWFMGRIEGQVGGNGFAVGSGLTLADVLIHNTFAETLRESDAPDTMKAHRRAPCGLDEARMAAVLAEHPKLAKICDSVSSHEGFKRWIETRGLQKF